MLQRLLDETHHKMSLNPARDNEGSAQQLQSHPDDTFNHDENERPIERKADYDAQKDDYSGKSKDHTHKNEIVSDQASEVLYVSPTYSGKTHDKALLEEEGLIWLSGIKLRQDTGYQGYNPVGVTVIQPTKKPRGATLTDQQKEVNDYGLEVHRFESE